MLEKLFGLSSDPMTVDEFWQIFGLYGENKDKEAKKLTRGRKKAYSKHFDDMLETAHNWDLWGAAYIIYGGCGDDSFADFKGGLLLQGRKIFEAVLNDPECLVELSNQIDLSKLQSQEFGSSGTKEPTGAPWEEGDLETRFPRLWAKFGENPIDPE